LGREKAERAHPAGPGFFLWERLFFEPGGDDFPKGWEAEQKRGGPFGRSYTLGRTEGGGPVLFRGGGLIGPPLKIPRLGIFFFFGGGGGAVTRLKRRDPKSPPMASRGKKRDKTFARKGGERGAILFPGIFPAERGWGGRSAERTFFLRGRKEGKNKRGGGEPVWAGKTPNPPQGGTKVFGHRIFCFFRGKNPLTRESRSAGGPGRATPRGRGGGAPPGRGGIPFPGKGAGKGKPTRGPQTDGGGARRWDPRPFSVALLHGVKTQPGGNGRGDVPRPPIFSFCVDGKKKGSFFFFWEAPDPGGKRGRSGGP